MHPKATEYDRLYPGALDDEAQMVERMERIETKQRGAKRYYAVPAMPWKERTNEKGNHPHRHGR